MLSDGIKMRNQCLLGNWRRLPHWVFNHTDRLCCVVQNLIDVADCMNPSCLSQCLVPGVGNRNEGRGDDSNEVAFGVTAHLSGRSACQLWAMLNYWRFDPLTEGGSDGAGKSDSIKKRALTLDAGFSRQPLIDCLGHGMERDVCLIHRWAVEEHAPR